MRGASENKVRASEPMDGELDLAGIGRAVAAKRLFIFGVTGLALAGSIAFVLLATPRYTGEAKVIVENQESFFTRPDRETGGEPSTQPPDAEAIASQVQLVTSRDLARKAIKALDLQGNPEFDPLANGPGLVSELLSLVGLRRPKSDMAPEDRILESYYERLNVFSVVKSRVLQIEFTSRDPDLAAKGANTIAGLYIDFQSDAKRESARQAAASLASLTASLRKKVAEAEARAADFRATNSLVLGANNVTMTNQQLADLTTQMAAARNAQADAQAKARLLRDMLRQGRLGEISDVANNDLIRRLSEQRATLRAQIASESRTLLPGHPRIKELNAQLAELENQIRGAVERTARTLENDARVSAGRVENLQTAIDQQKKLLGGASGQEAHARELDLEARLLRDQLQASTAKYQDAVARENSQSTPADARVISRAIAPELPSFPKKIPIVAFATIAAFVLSLGGVLAGELLSGRAYARRPDEAVNPPAALDPHPAEPGFAPSPAIEHPAMAAGFPTHGGGSQADGSRGGMHDAVADLAGQIESDVAMSEATRILVAGAESGTAAQDAALTLARALSHDRRAILVELGPEGPGPGILGGRAGLGDLLAGQASFEDVICRDQGSRLHMLAKGNGPIVTGGSLDVVIAALSHTYDYLILLTPPVGEDGLATSFAARADYALLACVAGEDAEPAVAGACEKLSEAGARQVMVVNAETAHPANRRDAA
jgi:uncharacterized protein involved in exopolysaccharide biosynthesis/Mrp family chromosome partitioning ATPase